MTLRAIRAGLRTLFRRSEVDRDLDDEIAQYVEAATRENMRAGMSAAEAERMARASLGSVASVHEQALSRRWEAGAESVMADIAYAVRNLRRNPGFTVAALLTIALGIGANTAMFSVVNAVMLRPLPWPDADRLALLWTDDVARSLHREPTAYATIADWRSSNRTFGDIAYYATQRVALIPDDPARGRGRSRSAQVSANLFQVLRVPAAEGRVITSADEEARTPVAVISHALWQSWLAGAPDILGKPFTVDDASTGGVQTLTVIGVMPAGFYFPDRLTDIWTPATTYGRFDRERSERFASSSRRWTALGRLSPGSSIDDARADLGRIGRYLAAVHVNTVPDFPGFGTTVLPVLDVITGQSVQSALWVLLGAVSVVLLVACVNVANLLLARGAARQREFAVRRALGASRSRIVRQLVTESVLLSLAGGMMGVLVGAWATAILGTAARGFVPRIDEITIDWRVLLFALAVSLCAGLIFGLAPALRLSRADATATLREGDRNTGNAHLRRSRDFLVVAEFALALTLLTGAGLLLRSLSHLHSVDPGFDPTNVLTVRIEFPTDATPTTVQPSEIAPSRARARVAVANVLIDRVAALPGVAAAGFSDDLFVAGQGNASIIVPGRTATALSGELNDGAVTAGFLDVLRVPLRRGRFLNAEDAQRKIGAMWPAVLPGSTSPVDTLALSEPVVVNEAFARRFFPGEEALGKRFRTADRNKAYWYEIVGVIGDMHRQGLERDLIPEYFGPLIPSGNSRADLLVRTTGDPLALAASLRREVNAVLPGATVVSMATADALLGGFSALRRLQTWLLTAFSLLALVLAAIGIFGVMHFTVAERTREIGVRMALGARPASVMGLVLGQGMRTATVGIGLGVAASLATTRALSNLMFGIDSTDPATFAVVALLLALVAWSACWLAGRRALRIDPVRALRDG
jgi:predicted permease